MIHLDLSYGWYLKTATDNFISHGTTHKHAVPTQNRPHSTHTQLTIMCPSGFSASSTAEEVTQGIDGSGLTAIVTGYISFFFFFLFFFFENMGIVPSVLLVSILIDKLMFHFWVDRFGLAWLTLFFLNFTTIFFFKFFLYIFKFIICLLQQQY